MCGMLQISEGSIASVFDEEFRSSLGNRQPYYYAIQHNK